MKLKRYLFAFASASLLLTSCYKDTGNTERSEIGDIVVTMNSHYDVITKYDNLVITPKIETVYDESELDYYWVLQNDNNNNEQIKTVRDTISRERILDHHFSLDVADNFYIYVYVQHKKNGYHRHARASVTVGSVYSRGFYILKETAGGDTDLDLLLMDDRMEHDIITEFQGRPLGGAPRSLGVQYGRPMIDPDTDLRSNHNSLGIITYDKNFQILRAKDMYLAFDNDNMYYEKPADEIPYKFDMGFGCEYFSSNGVYSSITYQVGSGFLGIAEGPKGGSDHWAFSTKQTGMIYWDETNSRILYTTWMDMGGGSTICTDAAFDGLDQYNCLFMGSHLGIVYGIFQKKADGSLSIYEFEGTAYYFPPSVNRVTPIDAASKLNDAVVIATNQFTAKYIYFTDTDNKLYYMDMTVGGDMTPTEFTPEDLPADETITYMSHQYYNVKALLFSYFTVATYKDGKYNVYMYNLLGGLPNGVPVKTAAGTGKVKTINYLGTITKYMFTDLQMDADYSDGNASLRFRWTH